ncbi:hypothetical protein BKH45_02300 [Helicobacter sp. 11S03491-1]|nr:hypothetical protein BKH45_02300 [Helicobacter sp. 11S03491-1]
MSVFVSLIQILGSCCVHLSGADLRPRNHIRPLNNDIYTPQMSSAANGRDVVNIVNPGVEGISHNKYESFDIERDNGVILNNSQKNGISVTGGYVTANPNLSSNAKLIINEVISGKNSSLNGTLEVFGKSADVIIANENGLVVNGATFINTNGVTLTTGLIDRSNHQIVVKGGNVSILERGVGLSGDYFSIISRSMQLLGSISDLDGKAVQRLNLIGGLNSVGLGISMDNPQIKATAQSESKKPQLSIDGNLLGSMYAGYIRFISTEEGVGVRHSGIIRSANDIVVDAKGDISTTALVGQNISIDTSGKLNNDGVIVAGKNLKAKATDLNNKSQINQETIDKLGLKLETSYIEGKNADFKIQNLHNDGGIVGTETLSLVSENSKGIFRNTGEIISKNTQIQSGSFENNGKISANQLQLQSGDITNSGAMIAGILNANVQNNFINQGTIESNRMKLQSGNLQNNGGIRASIFELDAQKLVNTSEMNIYNGTINVGNVLNSGKIQSENKLSFDFKDTSKSLLEVLENQNGTIESKGILSIHTGAVNINASLGKISAHEGLLIQSEGDIVIQDSFSNIGSIRLKAAGNITNNANTLLASQKNIALEAKMDFTNQEGSYIFGNNVAIEAHNITNQEDAFIDSGNQIFLKADTINNNAGFINSSGDMTILTRVLNNTAREMGNISFRFNEKKPLYYYFSKSYFWNRDFRANYIGYDIKNDLSNKQGIIKAGGRISVSSESGKTSVYNNNSIIGASKDIHVRGDFHNITTSKEYGVGRLLGMFTIENIEAEPTFAGHLVTYHLGGGNIFGVLNKARNAADDNAGYFGLLKDMASKDSFFKELMDKAYGQDWITQSDPHKLQFNNDAYYYFTSKNPAQVLSGGNIITEDGSFFNGTGSIQQMHADIKDLQTKLEDIKESNSNANQVNATNIAQNEDQALKDTENTKEPTNSQGQLEGVKKFETTKIETLGDSLKATQKPTNTESTPAEEKIYDSVGLDEEGILRLGQRLLFQKNTQPFTQKINYYIETRPNLVDMSQFYGSEYFLKQVGYTTDKTISVIGDAYYENRLLNEQLTKNLGYNNSLDTKDVKAFLDNALKEQKKLGLVIGTPLSKEQVEKLDTDIVWYVNKKINGQDVLVPQLYYSKNTSFKKIPSKSQDANRSRVAAVGDIFLDTDAFSNKSSDIDAIGDVVINTKNIAKNIGGSISGNHTDIQAGKFVSESSINTDDKGNPQILSQAKITSKLGVNIRAKGDIDIKNTAIESGKNGNGINIISKNGFVRIVDEEIKKVDYNQEHKNDADTSWVSTTLVQTSSVSGSSIKGSNINIRSHKGTTIKGSAFDQTSEEGEVNIFSDGDINILAGKQDASIKNETYFSGVNATTGLREYATTTSTDGNSKTAVGSSIKALGNINIYSKKKLNVQTSQIDSDKKTILYGKEKVDILDTQNTATLSSSHLSFQVLGIKGGNQNQNTSRSSVASLRGGNGLFIGSEGDIKIVGAKLEGKGDEGAIVSSTLGKVTIQAGKNTNHNDGQSYGFGVVGSVKAGLMGNQASASFGVDGNKAQAQSNFDPATLTSGKVQMDSLASAEIGLELGYNYQTSDDVYYTNANIKTTTGNIVLSGKDAVDIGGADFDSGKHVILKGGSILSTKYIGDSTSSSIGINVSLKQKFAATSSVADTMNMVSDIATTAANGGNLNAGIVAAGAAGAVTNLIFNDLAGGVSTQEAGVQVGYENSHKNFENTTNVKANGKVLIQSTTGNVELAGVNFQAEDLYIHSAKNTLIRAAKSTSEESGFSVGVQLRLQESAGYSALWGGNTDVGIGGSVNFSLTNKNETTNQTAQFNIKNQAIVVSKEDFNMLGGKINAGSADVFVGGNMHIASLKDSKDSKSIHASGGGDISLGVATNTIAKGDVSLNGGGGYYYENSDSVGMQSGIATQGKLNVHVKGDAKLEGAILDSKTKEGDFDVAGKLDVLDLALHQSTGGGSAYLSGGTSGSFGAQADIGDYKDQKSTLHTAINIKTNAKKGVMINGVSSSVDDLYTDTQNTQVVLTDTSFAGGNMSFSGDIHQAKQLPKKLFGSKNKPTHTAQNSDNVIFSGPAEPISYEPVVLRTENLLYAPPPKKPRVDTPEGNISQENQSEQIPLSNPSVSSSNPADMQLPTGGTVASTLLAQKDEMPLQPSVVLSQSELSWMKNLSGSDTEETHVIQNPIDGKKLGVGSYGEAYLVDHEGKDYVVKVPTKPEYLANLSQEAQILNSIPQHPNIVKTEGIKEIQGQQGLLLEYVKGHTLDNVLGTLKDAYDKNQINHSEFYGSVSHLTKGILEGMNHLKNNGIVHGDIKGNNILLDTQTYEPKIIDFGLARKVGDEAKAGHPLFASPEILDSMLGISKQQRADDKQDVYALGQFVHKIGEGQNHVFGAKPEADPLEYVMKKRIDKLQEEGKLENYQPLVRQEQSGLKESGKYGYEGAYVQFVNGALAIDPNKRLNAQNLLESDFIQDALIQSHEVPKVLDKAGIDLGDWETVIQGHYSEQPQQPNFSPNTKPLSIAPNVAMNPEPKAPQSSSSLSSVPTEQTSLVKRIKNLFVKNKASYKTDDLGSASEDVQALSYKKINDNLPPKSEAVKNEQAFIAWQNKRQKDLEKFDNMGEVIPASIPLVQKNQPSDSDMKDLLDFMDRGVFEVQDINLSQTASLLNGLTKNLAFLKHRNYDEIKENFTVLLSEIGENLPYHNDSKDYRDLTRGVYQDLDKKLLDDPAIKNYLTTSDFTSKRDFKDFSQIIINAYTDALKKTNLNVSDPKIVLSSSYPNAYYSFEKDSVHLPSPESYKNIYFPDKTPTSQEVGLMLLDTVVHEMTHKQQATFVKNLDNPKLSQSIKDYASIIQANAQFYAKANDNYHLYRDQILEKEAFEHGSASKDKFQHFLSQTPQSSNQSFMTSSDPASSRNPLLQRITKMFSTQRSGDDLNAPLSIAPNVAMNPEPKAPQSSSSLSSVPTEQTSLVKRIKNLFVKNKASYKTDDLGSASEDVQALSYKKINDNLPPKSEAVKNEQAFIAWQNKRQKDLEKFDNMGEVIPASIPLVQKNQPSDSDMKDLLDFMDRGVFEVQDINLSQTASLLNGLTKNLAFLKHRNYDEIKENFTVLLSEIGENLPYHNDSKDYRDLTRGVYQDLDKKLLDDPAIKNYLTTSDFTSKRDFKDFSQIIINAYTDALKKTNLNVSDPKIVLSSSYPNAYYSFEKDSVHLPSPESYKNIYFPDKTPTSQEVGLMLLDTVVHEMTHKQQATFVKNLDNPKLSQSIKDYASIIQANAQFYAKANDNYHLYRDQILEKEAFEHGSASKDKFQHFLSQTPQSSNQSFMTSSDPASSRNPLLQRITKMFSTQRSGDDLNAPALRIKKSKTTETAGEQEIQIEHIPTQNHKNLESPLSGEPTFSNVTLVYGLSETREDLLEAVRDSELIKRPFIGDDYLDALNGIDFDRVERFDDFASFVAMGKPNLLKEEILNYQAIVNNIGDESSNSVPREDNKKVFEALMSDQNTIQILKTIDAKNKAIDQIKITAISHDMRELLNFIEGDVVNLQNLTPHEKELYDQYIEYIDPMIDSRFFEAKTKEVLKQVLDNGGKIYFNLDEIVTNYKPHADEILNVDLTKLKNIFKPDYEYYKSVTSGELRYIYENYREHPNLKWTIKKQVIENPFKNPEVIKIIQSELKHSKAQ